MEAVHVAAAIQSGAALLHGVEMMNMVSSVIKEMKKIVIDN